jgi:predicted metal-dependent hydrolase
MPAADRRAALEAGLAAYAAGDFFLAHELLEPPWMGTRDLAERELVQGVIKLAAAFVHGARSNPAGIEKNLRGARERIANGLPAGPALRIDAPALLRAIDEWLADPTAHGASAAGEWEAIEIRRLTGRAARSTALDFAGKRSEA